MGQETCLKIAASLNIQIRVIEQALKYYYRKRTTAQDKLSN